MKFKSILFIIILSACSPQLKTLNIKEPYTANGFAYIYNEPDFNEKIIKVFQKTDPKNMAGFINIIESL